MTEISLQTLESVRNYYGKVLKSKDDLKTSACCSTESMPTSLRQLALDLHPEVSERFYGCGSPFPPALENKTVLDLGCGSGRDCYLLSKLVGKSGSVIGIDMTDEQLDVARRHSAYHAEKFGYERSNVTFVKGYVEDLEGAGICSDSVDVVVSNCVVNLSPDKRRVFSEIFRVLKPGGELYFSDVFADRRVPAHLANDPVVLGECLGGALYLEDFRRLLLQLHCKDFRVISKTPITLHNEELLAKTGLINFFSVTIRAFKIDSLEDKCEDYGQVAYYLGTIPEHRHAFVLDDHHVFKTNQPMLVCSNTASMIEQSRFKPHFKIIGDTSTHFGLFDCAPAATSASPTGGACC